MPHTHVPLLLSLSLSRLCTGASRGLNLGAVRAMEGVGRPQGLLRLLTARGDVGVERTGAEGDGDSCEGERCE